VKREECELMNECHQTLAVYFKEEEEEEEEEQEEEEEEGGVMKWGLAP
jgi:hypothetical protein